MTHTDNITHIQTTNHYKEKDPHTCCISHIIIRETGTVNNKWQVKQRVYFDRLPWHNVSLTSEKVPISLDIFHIYKYIPLDILPTVAAPTLIDKETSGHFLNQFYDKFKVWTETPSGFASTFLLPLSLLRINRRKAIFNWIIGKFWSSLLLLNGIT